MYAIKRCKLIIAIADNTQAKKKKIAAADFTLIENEIKKSIANPIQLNVFLESFQQYNKEQLWSVLDFLQSEEKIHISESKEIIWLN